MASSQPALSDPDKLGVLIQCRQKMDELKLDTLKIFANSVISLLPPKQIKKLLFVGLNSIKNDIEYHQLFKIKSVITGIIEQSQPPKRKNKRNKSNTMVNKQPILKIPKNASLSRFIPTDIIGNSICQYLKMSTITQLARCDRNLSVICHTPTSINNLQHRYDPYQYALHQHPFVIDGHYFLHQDMHRFQNVQQLSIYVDTLMDFNVFNACKKVKHLSIYDWLFGDTNNFDLTDMKLLPFLEHIKWCNLGDLPFFLSFLEQYKAQNPIENKSKYFTDIIYNLQSIEFIQCDFEDIEYYSIDDVDEFVPKYNHFLHFMFQQQPNCLKVLKIENSYLNIANLHAFGLQELEQKFNNIERIKDALKNIKGFCCSTNQIHDNYFYDLSAKILSHLSHFTELESIHTHNTELLGLYLHNTNISTLHQITELCITVSSVSGLTLMRKLRDWTPNVENLCLVFDADHEKKDYLLSMVPMIRNILKFTGNLKLFCIVMKMEDELLEVDTTADAEHCDKVLDVLIKFGLSLKQSLQEIMNSYRPESACKVPLIFKFHIKSSHYYYNTKCKMKDSFRFQGLSDMIQHLIMNYLMAFPMGHIQFKMSWNIEDYNWISNALQYALKQTDILFDVDIKNGGNLNHIKTDHNPGRCYDAMDYTQFAIGARIKSVDKRVEYDKRWKVDCQYCCNTPWI